MRVTPKFSWLLCAIVLLGGCATGDFGGLPGTSAESRAESQARRGDHAAAAATYIGLASGATGTERDRLTLLAVEQWLDAGDGRRARNALRSVAKPAGGDLLHLWNTDAAAMYLFLGRPDDALAILEEMSAQSLPKRHRLRVEALRADAWFQKDNPSHAVQLYMQRERWLTTASEVDVNRQRLWAGLLVTSPIASRSAAEVATNSEVRGWLSLGALAASTGQQGIGWSNGAARWQEFYPNHPANDVIGDILTVVAGDSDYPRRIALLLPVSGRNATSGNAVQNGFFGAYFSAAAGLQDAQQIAIYDLGKSTVTDAYAQAVDDGADFVVGPLVKGDVAKLAQVPMLSVPVLALNNLSDELPPPPGFFQFALAPEDEAASAALRALSDGSINAVALYPNNDWGRRVANSFATELEANGGRLLDHSSYQPGTQDFALEIESLMGLSQSVARYNRMRANLGEALQFDPRRRQDVDFVFLAADSKSGRLIKSQLKFHYAGDLPVYATSFIFSNDGRSNRDLNGVMFSDAPWIIDPPAWLADYPEMYDEFWPDQQRAGRLHALGYDAYNLASSLFAGTTNEQQLRGATGLLYVDPNGRVRRELAWAQFESGNPVPLRSTEDGLPDDSTVPIPYDDVAPIDASEMPTEWPQQTLNQ